MTTREAAYSALFGLVSQGEGLGGLITWGAGNQLLFTSRRVRHFGDPKPQPALYQSEPHEALSQGYGVPTKHVLGVNWIVYHQAGKNQNSVPTTTNNQILDALETALAPVPADPGYVNNLQTLGGLVKHVWIDGQLIKAAGDIDNQAILILPLKILLP